MVDKASFARFDYGENLKSVPLAKKFVVRRKAMSTVKEVNGTAVCERQDIVDFAQACAELVDVVWSDERQYGVHVPARTHRGNVINRARKGKSLLLLLFHFVHSFILLSLACRLKNGVNKTRQDKSRRAEKDQTKRDGTDCHFVVCRLSFVVWSFAICLLIALSFVVCRLSVVVCRLSFVVCRLSCVVGFSFIVNVVCRLSFVSRSNLFRKQRHKTRQTK
jgi:hypothetical protein